MFRYCGRITIVLFILGFVLIISSSHTALSAPPSPRDNPEFWDKLSGIVVIDPTWSSSPPFQLPILPASINDILTVLGDVRLVPNVLCNQDQTAQAQNEPSIDLNPSNPYHIIATSNDYRLRVNPPPEHDARAGYYVSFDGGNTWPGDGIIDISTIPNTIAAGDPAIAIHDINTVYY